MTQPPSGSATDNKNPATGQESSHDEALTDASTMRALAHPLRIRLLEALTREGPLTATQAAELLDDTPGNMSWHLQILARYGFIEEAPGAKGRSRPWQVASRRRTFSFSSTDADQEQTAAAMALETSFHERTYRELQEWQGLRHSYPQPWDTSGFTSNSTLYLTPDEFEQVAQGLLAVVDEFRDRTHDKSKRPPGSQPVRVVSVGYPLPPTPSGN